MKLTKHRKQIKQQRRKTHKNKNKKMGKYKGGQTQTHEENINKKRKGGEHNKINKTKKRTKTQIFAKNKTK